MITSATLDTPASHLHHAPPDNSLLPVQLQPLEVSCLSFCNALPFFSTACSLFVQNTGGGVPQFFCASLPTNLRSSLGGKSNVLAPPLFSYSYELLFPQPLCFHMDLSCPRGVTPPYGARISSSDVRIFRRFVTPFPLTSEKRGYPMCAIYFH
jgi:hypothetical protein